MHWYQLSSQDAVSRLKSDPMLGLSSAEVSKRISQYGHNELRGAVPEHIWKKFFRQFSSFLVLILLAACGISIILGELTDAMVIVTIVILNAALGIFQEAKAEEALNELKKISAPTCKVIRNGEIISVHPRELVPGDIVVIEDGDLVPADLRILESYNLIAEEASLTGESVPVDKHTLAIHEITSLAERNNMAFMGTHVVSGRGKGIVVSTAMQTEIGTIANMLQQSPQSDITPLQRKLEEFGRILGFLCIGVCAVVFAVGISRAYREGTLVISNLQQIIMTSVSLAVAAVPEGLPAIVAIVLAFGMQRMARKNAIMKKLHAVETLGSVSVICTDKTGTLTQNQMTVVKIFTAAGTFSVSGEGYAPLGLFFLEKTPVEVKTYNELDLILQAAVLCNNAELTLNDGQNWTIAGDPTEGALIVAAAKAGYTKKTITMSAPRAQEIPFDSNRKLMTTFHSYSGKIRMLSKGAPDVLLSRCTHIITKGKVYPLENTDRHKIQQAFQEMASNSLRVLALAYRELDALPDVTSPFDVERDLIFIGLIGMIDPPRPEARISIEVCQRAGIRTLMITGDHPNTAQAIAGYLGITAHDPTVITGEMLDAMTDEGLRHSVCMTNVFARVSPKHKLAIVNALQSNGYITAMTGDGVNDAPALQKADIGIAMGRTGTDVTKAAADMVITDDNFATIVAAVEEGRVVYANIRKFIHYLLSCNGSEVLTILIAALLGWPVPLLPTQLLWVNLVTDGLPALALGFEKKEPNIMDTKPRNSSEALISDTGYLLIGFQSFIMSLTVLGAFQYGLWASDGNVDLARTLSFFTLMTVQIISAYSARSINYSVLQLVFFSNKYLNLGVGISILLALLSVLGPLQGAFRTVDLTINDWLIVSILVPIPFIFAEATKLVLRRLRITG